MAFNNTNHHMRVMIANDVEQQGDSENRAAADQAECKSDQQTGYHCQALL